MTEFRPDRFEVLPTVIKNLLIINGLFYLAQYIFKLNGLFNMDEAFALHHIKSPSFQPWQLVTYLFMHAGFLHVFLNMLGLWTLGAVLENIWGSRRFLTFYFLCGIGAGLIQLISLWFEHAAMINSFVSVQRYPEMGKVVDFFNRFIIPDYSLGKGILEKYTAPHATYNTTQMIAFIAEYTNKVISVPTMGASGAVFGVLAAFVYLFPNTTLNFYLVIPVKAKWVGIILFAQETYFIIKNSPADNVAHWAHLGGGLVGFLLVLTWNRKNREHFY